MKHKLTGSIAFQSILLILILLVLPISVAGYYLYAEVTDDLNKMDKEHLMNTSQATERLLQMYGETLLGTINSNSHWEENRLAVEKRDEKWIDEHVNSSMSALPNVHFIVTTDLDGKVISQAGDMKEFITQLTPDLMKRSNKESNFYGLFQTSKGLSILSVSKITDDQGTAQPTGILIYGRILDNNALEKIKNTLHADISLLTESDTLLSTSNEITKQSLSPYLQDAITKSNLAIYSTTHVDSKNNAQFITTLKDFTDKPIGLLYVSQPIDTSSEIHKNLIVVNQVIGIIFILVILLIVWIIYRRIITPIQQLVIISGELSQGVLSKKVSEKMANRRDELGKLGHSINIMISNFRSLIEQVTESTKFVASASKELSISAEETGRNATQISSAVQEVASGAEAQLLEGNESAKAINEMTQGIQHVAHTISSISSDSEQTALAAEQGNDSIQKTVDQMHHINESLHESVAKVTKLNEHSKEIGQIATLITSVANQTNLLALNAAIEAARAGENGKGFAVVAGEVRELAEQTTISAKKVSDLIRVIQDESVSSVQSLDIVNQEVQEGLNIVNETGNVFKNILLSAQNVAQETEEVSAMSEQMSASTKQIFIAMEKMANIAEDAANKSQNVASSSQEQLASMEEMVSSTNSLTDMTQHLESLINKFKL